MLVVLDDPQDHGPGVKLGLLYDRELLDVLADALVVFLVVVLVLAKALSIGEPEHCNRPVLELAEQGHCIELYRFLGGLCGETCCKRSSQYHA